MPEAPKTGLRLAAAPAAGASTNALATALAAASTDDIIANLSDEHRTKIAASLAPPAPAAAKPGNDPEDPDGDGDASGGDDGDEDDKKMKKAKAESFAAGQKAENERFAAVFASEHYAGREAMANELLVSDANLSAESIGKVLAKTPKGGDASAEMLAALRGKNPNIGASADDTGASNASADHGWGKAHARAGALYGLKPAAAK